MNRGHTNLVEALTIVFLFLAVLYLIRALGWV